MKSITKALIFLCILCALFAINATATSNDKLPSKDEVNSFLSDMKNCTSSEIFNKVKEVHPGWNVDLITCSTCSGDEEAIALYYKNSESANGYGSIYFKDGAIVSSSSLKGYTTKDKYVGKLDEENGKEAKEDSVNEECNDGSCKEEVNDSEKEEVSIDNNSKLTVEERKAAFMKFLETKDSVTLKEVQEELDKCFPEDVEV